jgi:hypothetical protein
MIGFQNPLGALALVAVGVLVALYLRDRRHGIVPVGSLFLWRQVPARALARQRLRADALFLLRLGLLLALIAGLLRPYLEGAALPARTRALLLVLDVSASMRAREPDGTRFELARRRAGELVGELVGVEDVMLVTAAERPHVVLRWTADHARVRSRLETLEPLDVPGTLAPAVRLALAAARARPGTRVAVLTDLPPTASGCEEDERARLDWIQVGQTDDNLAIASLVVERPLFRPLAEATATLVVRNYGHVLRHAVLEASVEGMLWSRQEIAVQPSASDRFVLTRPPRTGLVQAALTVDDALAVDNEALGWVDPDQPLDLLVVSDAYEPAASLTAVAAAVPGSRVRRVSPASFYAGNAGPSVVVFDRVEPAGAKRVAHALFVAPPPGSRVCDSAASITGAAVVDWAVDHPALDGLAGLESLELPRVQALAARPWAEPVVLAAARGRAFPILLAGRHDGRRIACLGAELTEPLAASDRVPLLLLTLATLHWLGGADGGPVRVETGVPARLPEPGLGGNDDLVVTDDPPTVVARRAGIYRLGGRLVLANFFDERESDIGRSGSSEIRATRQDALPPAGNARREIGWWLYLLAAVLLVVEWVVWRRRVAA